MLKKPYNSINDKRGHSKECLHFVTKISFAFTELCWEICFSRRWGNDDKMQSLPGIAVAQALTEADENNDAKVFRKNEILAVNRVLEVRWNKSEGK